MVNVVYIIFYRIDNDQSFQASIMWRRPLFQIAKIFWRFSSMNPNSAISPFKFKWFRSSKSSSRRVNCFSIGIGSFALSRVGSSNAIGIVFAHIKSVFLLILRQLMPSFVYTAQFYCTCSCNVGVAAHICPGGCALLFLQQNCFSVSDHIFAVLEQKPIVQFFKKCQSFKPFFFK